MSYLVYSDIMRLTTKYGILLEDYYRTHSPYRRNCQINNRTHWWRLTPYDLQESIYYFCKHLALPSFGVISLLLSLFFRSFNIPFSDFLIGFFLYSSILFLLSVGREILRTIKYRIRYGKISDIYDYPIEEEETLFQICTNRISQTNLKIAFVGDIMMVNDFNLLFDQEVIDFFEDVDLIVGNLEGILHNLICVPKTKQMHRDPPIITALETLITNEGLITNETLWLLSVSNNHSCDFGSLDFCNSLQYIQRRAGFNVFGSNLVPTVLCEYEDPNDNTQQRNDISISTVSEWCNQKKWSCIFKYEDARIKTLYRLGKFNILYPHWSYENEKYVRSRIQKDVKALLTGREQDYSLFQRFVRKCFVTKITPCESRKWDLIFGHHPHVRQPIMIVPDYFMKNRRKVWYKKLVAFSGGNFTSGATFFRKKKHIRGIILKCEIGPLEGHPEKIVVGNVKWRKTVNRLDKNTDPYTKVVIIDRKRYITYNRGALIWGIILTAIFLPIFMICVYIK